MNLETSRAWGKFRNSGLLWLINTMLHNFKYAIVVTMDQDANVVDVRPMPVQYHGFSNKNNIDGLSQLSDHIHGEIVSREGTK